MKEENIYVSEPAWLVRRNTLNKCKGATMKGKKTQIRGRIVWLMKRNNTIQ